MPGTRMLTRRRADKKTRCPILILLLFSQPRRGLAMISIPRSQSTTKLPAGSEGCVSREAATRVRLRLGTFFDSRAQKKPHNPDLSPSCNPLHRDSLSRDFATVGKNRPRNNF
ncbi:hypothetical protein CH63R_10277 [Colletotrichum higginsianum IMI 349063]|uniref:Uncharacterized protein n=1 Tax=Colletotrichum higginsianum (strain IMI 349063) TaxID=759273 RepID=A0A1B7Y2D0_COLHI|nr:uncharacterized protein CH63R_10277 [Colletotrichum higginsianum IMI 349063]OBR06157.1 hypothetical protein CH63R_10277 [Colletotrichum higginsianum IMI 349063]